jgi:hypothetical protein
MVTSENPDFLFNPEAYKSSLVDIVGAGGAFSGECLLAYQQTLEKNGILYSVDPRLILRAGV